MQDNRRPLPQVTGTPRTPAERDRMMRARDRQMRVRKMRFVAEQAAQLGKKKDD